MGEPCFVALFPLDDLSSQVGSEADMVSINQSFMLPVGLDWKGLAGA